MKTSEWLALVVFLGANVLVPLVCGDIFPFTSSPMFRDAPRAYCVYRAFGPDGMEIPVETLLLQRVYDGNPPGYGVGIRPPDTLARFGEIAAESEIKKHVARHMAGYEFVTIEQDVVACEDGVCRVCQTNRFRVEPAAP